MLRASIRIEGAREVIRALGQVPGDGEEALRRRSNELAYNLLRRMRRAAAREGRQAARAASTLRVVRGSLLPTVTAGPHPLLFGSEFGMTRHSGWYSRGRYYHSTGQQFGPWRGNEGYWFFPARRAADPVIGAAWRQAADDVIRSWSA